MATKRPKSAQIEDQSREITEEKTSNVAAELTLDNLPPELMALVEAKIAQMIPSAVASNTAQQSHGEDIFVVTNVDGIIRPNGGEWNGVISRSELESEGVDIQFLLNNNFITLR